MTLSLKAIIALVLALVLACGYVYIQNQKIDRLEADLKTTHSTLALLRTATARQFSELKTREAELEAVKTERMKNDAKFEVLKQNDPVACSWSASSLPASVVGFLCQGSRVPTVEPAARD